MGSKCNWRSQTHVSIQCRGESVLHRETVGRGIAEIGVEIKTPRGKQESWGRRLDWGLLSNPGTTRAVPAFGWSVKMMLRFLWTCKSWWRSHERTVTFLRVVAVWLVSHQGIAKEALVGTTVPQEDRSITHKTRSLAHTTIQGSSLFSVLGQQNCEYCNSQNGSALKWAVILASLMFHEL